MAQPCTFLPSPPQGPARRPPATRPAWTRRGSAPRCRRPAFPRALADHHPTTSSPFTTPNTTRRTPPRSSPLPIPAPPRGRAAASWRRRQGAPGADPPAPCRQSQSMTGLTVKAPRPSSTPHGAPQTLRLPPPARAPSLRWGGRQICPPPCRRPSTSTPSMGLRSRACTGRHHRCRTVHDRVLWARTGGRGTARPCRRGARWRATRRAPTRRASPCRPCTRA
mmetsp:Transcript_6245/g.14406  ORF Transcript_6245/g.14406 Transcript_6245/m.14406 type:complete len:222 (+) Transcript_6245:1149-1814(+)